MNIDHLIKDIFKKKGLLHTVDVQLFIENILKKYLETQDIPFEDFNLSNQFSFILSRKDIAHFKAPVRIAFLTNPNEVLFKDIKKLESKKGIEYEKNLEQYVDFTSNILNSTVKSNDFNSLVILTLLSDIEIEELNSRFSHILDFYHKDVQFLGTSFLNSIIQGIPSEVDELTNKLFSIKIKDLVFEKNEDWVIKRNELINNLKNLYQQSGKVSLLLGAGVSCSANLPSWDELISSLFITYLVNSSIDNEDLGSMNAGEYAEIIRHISRTFSEKYLKSALLSARYLRTGFSTQDQDSKGFIRELQKNLYNKEKKESDLIKSIGKLCIPTRTGAKVRSIITYNFDNLIEQHLSNSNLKFRSIFLDNDKYSNEELPLYHVHGFIPENIELENDSSFEKMDLIFSEEGYHRMYSNPYHWSNLIQLSTLKENTCIMIGLSMDDPNLRRLLEIAQAGNESIQHFAFLKRINISEISKKSKKSAFLESAFLERHHNLQELMFSELGVNIIWFENFEELPKLLDQLLN